MSARAQQPGRGAGDGTANVAPDGLPPAVIRAPRIRPILPKVCWSARHDAQDRPPVTHIVTDVDDSERSYCEPCAEVALAEIQDLVRRRMSQGYWRLS